MNRIFYVYRIVLFLISFGSLNLNLSLSWHLVVNENKIGLFTGLFSLILFSKILFTPLLSPLLDKSDRLSYLKFSNLILFISIFVVALGISSFLSTPLLIIVLIIIGAAQALNLTIRESALSNIVAENKISKALILSEVFESSGEITSCLLSSILISTLGPIVSLYFSSASFLIATIISVFAFRNQYVISNIKNSLTLSNWVNDLSQGFKYIICHKGILYFCLFSLFSNTLMGVFFLLRPYLIGISLNKGPGHYGLLEASTPVGFIIGSLMLSRLRKSFSRVWIIRFSLFGVCLSIFSFCLYTKSEVFLYISNICLGLSSILIPLTISERMYATIQKNMLSRVGSFMIFSTQIASPLGLALSPFLIEAFTVKSLIIIITYILFILSVILLMSKDFNYLLDGKQKRVRNSSV